MDASKALAKFKEESGKKAERWKQERSMVAGRDVAGNLLAPVAGTGIAAVAGYIDGRLSAGAKDGKPHHAAGYVVAALGVAALGAGVAMGKPTLARIGSEATTAIGAGLSYTYAFDSGFKGALEMAAKKAATAAAAPAVPAA